MAADAENGTGDGGEKWCEEEERKAAALELEAIEPSSVEAKSWRGISIQIYPGEQGCLLLWFEGAC